MKYGLYLKDSANAEWKDQFLDYDRLKGLIKTLQQKFKLANQDPVGISSGGVSVSVPRPTDAAGQPKAPTRIDRADSMMGAENVDSQEEFYTVLEDEMKKIEQFTIQKLKEIRRELRDIESDIEDWNAKYGDGSEGNTQQEKLQKRLEVIGDTFMLLEKYVNLNFTGFHKILKKHDRWLPNPCKAFYLTRLHDQSWVRGDYSDVIVSLSRAYSALRRDEKVEEKESAAQGFVRSTRKYWVALEDITAVKKIVLQHLPVFLQEEFKEGATDSQLVNSVYCDNYWMELYHGRLEKTAGAIALRFRWYGTGQPKKVFVERKTHRESWCGDLSVKERFVVDESEVLGMLDGKYNIKEQKAKMKARGVSAAQIADWEQLAREITSAISNKQLRPVMRTQYMRTAFQIPYDATVRVSLDSNLTMIVDRTKSTADGDAWYRDPTTPVPLNEITRFPHAVLEVKLQLESEDQTPGWVTDLIKSGMLMEAHKFSKFIHGCAVLLPEEVRAAPYWLDDESLRQSIINSGAEDVLRPAVGQPSANQIYNNLLPHDHDPHVMARQQEGAAAGGGSQPYRPPAPFWTSKENSVNKNRATGAMLEDGDCLTCGGEWAHEGPIQHITRQKAEPKLEFANERTFIKWLHMAVILSSISIGVLAFTDKHSQAQYYALSLLPVSLCFIGYALRTFLLRGSKIKGRSDVRWDDPAGPVVLTTLLIVALSVQFFFQVMKIIEDHKINW
jgi:SPX domain protein involved in polyphosphate accumulation/uncharacterized membrane protein YidH (DUF202 family)